MLRRYHITLGARTTAGGVVKTASTTSSIDESPLAVEGDLVDCPSCGTEGVIHVVPPRLSHRVDGRECALSDDLCICACKPFPKLIAKQDFKFLVIAVADVESVDQATERSAGIRTNGASAPHGDHDEQAQLVSYSVAGMPFYIETLDGRIFSGRTGSDGLLPRIATNGAAEYLVYWGDEALVKSSAGPSHA